MDLRVSYGDTEKLLFGNGTRLIVRPKEKDVTGPKLSVFYPPVTPEKDLVPATVCLADDFFPKTIQLSLKVEGHNQTTMTKSAIVTDDGYYRASNFLPVPSGQSNLIICEAKHEDSHFIVNVTTGGETQDSKNVCKGPSSDNMEAEIASFQDKQRGNFLSLTVMGLRFLLFKSVAINLLMTARAWLL